MKDANGCIASDNAKCAETTAAPTQKKANSATTTTREVNTFTVKESNNKNVSIKVYPNPFQSRVQFEVNVQEAGNATLEIFNMMGQKVKTVYNGHLNKGVQYFTTELPAGTHQLIYTLQTENEKMSGKMIRE